MNSLELFCEPWIRELVSDTFAIKLDSELLKVPMIYTSSQVENERMRTGNEFKKKRRV